MEEKNKPQESLDSADSLEAPEAVAQPENVVNASSGNNASPKPSVSKFNFQAYIQSLVNKVNVYLLLFIFILILAAVVMFIAIQSSKNQAQLEQTQTQKLTEDALASLEGTESRVGDPKQLLSIESNAIFTGKVLIRDSLDVAGSIKVGGALSLPGITVSGTSQFDEVQLNSLSISGNANIQGQVTIQKSLSVASNGSFSGTLSAAVISTDKLVLNQDIQLNRHIDAGGGSPRIAPGPAIGSGGTVSISGSDTAGTVTINNGGGASTGTVATVIFAVKFTGNPHVVITPVCNAGCPTNFYISSRTATGFSIGISGSNPGGSFSFDYIAID